MASPPCRLVVGAMTSRVVKIYATGSEEFIEEDRPTIYATFGAGNTTDLEVHLTCVNESGDQGFAAWFKVADLQGVINATIENYQKGNPQQ